jgi:hypothetical protein
LPITTSIGSEIRSRWLARSQLVMAATVDGTGRDVGAVRLDRDHVTPEEQAIAIGKIGVVEVELAGVLLRAVPAIGDVHRQSGQERPATVGLICPGRELAGLARVSQWPGAPGTRSWGPVQIGIGVDSATVVGSAADGVGRATDGVGRPTDVGVFCHGRGARSGRGRAGTDQPACQEQDEPTGDCQGRSHHLVAHRVHPSFG